MTLQKIYSALMVAEAGSMDKVSASNEKKVQIVALHDGAVVVSTRKIRGWKNVAVN